jgi:small subunit ribosomal protein S27e
LKKNDENTRRNDLCKVQIHTSWMLNAQVVTKLQQVKEINKSFYIKLKISFIVFSHAQTVVLCVGCNYVLCSPSGGKARLTEGCSFRKKRDTPLARKDDTDRN